MTGLEVFFVVLIFLFTAPIILVLLFIIRQQRNHHHPQKALGQTGHQPASPLHVATAMPVQASPGMVGKTKVALPWMRPNYMAPDDYVRTGFDYMIPGTRAVALRHVGDQGGFMMIQSRIHRRKGGFFVIQRKIHLN